MLFMGEEWAASTPWQFFTDFDEPELASAVAEGRDEEFAEHGWDADEIPDPQDPEKETYLRSKLNWEEIDDADHARLRRIYRDLLWRYGRQPNPYLADPWLDHLAIDYDETQRWIVMHRARSRSRAT